MRHAWLGAVAVALFLACSDFQGAELRWCELHPEQCAVRLLSPSNGFATGSPHTGETTSGGRDPLRPTFRWHPLSWAKQYELQLDSSCDQSALASCAFAAPALSITTPETSFTPEERLPISETPPVGARYAWRVRGCEDASCSDWSAPRYLDVGVSPDDFDGDGYADVAVGAPFQAGEGGREGRVWLYRAVDGLLPSAPSRTYSSPAPQANELFGNVVAAAGDVNGDGYSDLVVSAPVSDGAAGVDQGRVFVLFGGPEGPVTESAVELAPPLPQTDAQFGFSIAGAGDVNGDGFDDVLVGSHRYSQTVVGAGAAFLFYGSATELGAHVQRLENLSSSPDAQFGVSVMGVGDLNGDGYDDVVIGSNRQATPAENEGAAFLFYGASGGLSATPDLMLDNPSNQANAFFGRGITGADFDGDGYSDLVVGAETYSSPESGEGSVFIFRGGPEGPMTIPSQVLDSPRGTVGANFGTRLSVGDVDGDGFLELAVSAYDEVSATGATDVGAVYVFRGSAEGVASTASWTLSNPTPDSPGSRFGLGLSASGDHNGDGFADIIVGAPFQSVSGSKEGLVALYRGAPQGVPAIPSQTLLSPSAQDSGAMGASIASFR